MRLPRTQFRGVAHFVYAKWPRSGPEVWRSEGVIATLWQPRLVSCAGLVGQVEVKRVVTLPWAQWSSASGFCRRDIVRLSQWHPEWLDKEDGPLIERL